MHGARAPRGPGHYKFSTGRYSCVLPSRLLAQYRTAAKDPELTSLRSELALVDARLCDLLSRIDTGESGAAWRALLHAHRAFKRAQRTGDAEVETCLEAGVLDYEAWRAIEALIEQRRKLAESEMKRPISLQSMLSAEQAMVLLGTVLDIIRRHITDRQVLSSIATDLQQLAGRDEWTYGLPEES